MKRSFKILVTKRYSERPIQSVECAKFLLARYKGMRCEKKKEGIRTMGRKVTNNKEIWRLLFKQFTLLSSSKYQT